MLLRFWNSYLRFSRYVTSAILRHTYGQVLYFGILFCEYNAFRKHVCGKKIVIQCMRIYILFDFALDPVWEVTYLGIKSVKYGSMLYTTYTWRTSTEGHACHFFHCVHTRCPSMVVGAPLIAGDLVDVHVYKLSCGVLTGVRNVNVLL